jgi:type II secretory pathway component PulK
MNRQNLKNQSRNNEQGVALLTVLVSILIMSLLTIEFQYSVAIERKLAYSELNQLQAHYLAKSGARFALLRLALFSRANKDKNLEAAKPFLSSIWSLPLPAFPPAQSSLKKLTKSDKDAAEKVLEETKISAGQFTQSISNESSKINLNYLIVPKEKRDGSQLSLNLSSGAPPTSLFEYVARLLFNTVSEILKKSENPIDEFGNVRAEEVVFDIMDWVNPNNVNFGTSNKDAFYEQQKPPYKAKRGRFFTLDELKLVKSVEDNLFKKLKPYVTVYSYDGKINLNDATKDVLKAIYPDFTEDDLNKIQEEKAKIGSWSSEDAFVNFVTKTLGRSGFTDLYRDKKEYPFTVNSYSFLIEALGTVPKNKVSIQRKIKVAVALTTASGSAKKSTATNPPDCEKDPDFFWYIAANACFARPTNEQDCVNNLVGQWVQENGKLGCRLNNQGTIFPPTSTKQAEPNALKILYWMET